MHPHYFHYSAQGQSDGTSIVTANLAETDERLSHIYTERAFHLSELTRELSLSPQIDELTLSAISEQLLLNSPDNTPYKAATVYADTVTLCSELAAALPSGFSRVFSDVFGQGAAIGTAAVGTVAYVPNSYTEQAFAALCSDIKNCRASYHHHFDDICQDVYNGHCQYGILPISSSFDGMLAGLYRMIASYKLKICAICRVEGAHDSHTVFALIVRSLALPEKAISCCMEMLYTPANAHGATDLLCIAALFGHRVLGAGSYGTEDSQTYRFCLDVRADAFYPFLIYLLLFCGDMTPVGLYQIES